MIPKIYATESIEPPVVTVSALSGRNASAGSFLSVTDVPRVVGNTDMILLGAVRMRQWRVVDNGCSPSFAYSTVSRMCSGNFAEGSNENRGSFYQELYPQGVSGAFFWQPSTGDASLTSNQTGMSYPGSGYSFLLPETQFQASQVVADLESSGWIDQLTAAVAVEVNTFHATSNAFVVDRLLFEFPASSGSISVSQVTSPILSETVVFAVDYSFEGALLFSLDFINILIFLTGIVGFSFLLYWARTRLFTTLWTYLDIITITLFLAYIAVRFHMYVSFHSSDFQSMSSSLSLQRSALSLQTGILISLAIRTLKFLQLGSFRIYNAFKSSFVHILALSTVSGLVLVGFSFGLHVVTGYNDPVYTDIKSAFSAVSASLLNVVWLTQTTGIVPFMNLFFIFIVYFIIVPLIIVFSAHGWILPEKNRKNNPLLAFLKRFWTVVIRRQVLVDSVTEPLLGIHMDKLPSVVRTGILRRRTKLRQRVEKRFGFIPNETSLEPHERDHEFFIPLAELESLLLQDPFARKILGSSDPNFVIDKFAKQSDDPINSVQADIMQKLDSSIQKNRLKPVIQVDSRIMALSKLISDILGKLQNAVLDDIQAVQAVSSSLLKSVGDIEDDMKRRRITVKTGSKK